MTSVPPFFRSLPLGIALAGLFAATLSAQSDPSASETMPPPLSRPQALASRGAFRYVRPEYLDVVLTSDKAILVQKSARRLSLYEKGEVVKTFLATVGRNEAKSKVKLGDWATPEGLYRVGKKKPDSKYYMALHINYPNDTDAERGLKMGIISPSEAKAIKSANAKGFLPPQDTRLGCDVEIHGGSNTLKDGDDGQPRLAGWTRGCVGLRNEDIEAVYAWAEVGTPVVITR